MVVRSPLTTSQPGRGPSRRSRSSRSVGQGDGGFSQPARVQVGPADRARCITACPFGVGGQGACAGVRRPGADAPAPRRGAARRPSSRRAWAKALRGSSVCHRGAAAGPAPCPRGRARGVGRHRARGMWPTSALRTALRPALGSHPPVEAPARAPATPCRSVATRTAHTPARRSRRPPPLGGPPARGTRPEVPVHSSAAGNRSSETDRRTSERS